MTETDSIDEIIETFEPKKRAASGPDDRRILSIAVPAEYKDKFDKLQIDSGREFGELLRTVIMRTIDKVQA